MPYNFMPPTTETLPMVGKQRKMGDGQLTLSSQTYESHRHQRQS